MNMTVAEQEAFRRDTKQQPHYEHNPRRLCARCDTMKQRTSGRWVSKTVWWCNVCLKKGEQND